MPDGRIRQVISGVESSPAVQGDDYGDGLWKCGNGYIGFCGAYEPFEQLGGRGSPVEFYPNIDFTHLEEAAMNEMTDTNAVEPAGITIMPPGCERYDEAVELLGDDTLKVCRVFAPELDTIGLVVLFSDWDRRAEAAAMAHLVRPSRDDTRTVPVAIYVGEP